jgi:hypothetical protein
MSQGLQGKSSYMRGLSSIYQPDYIGDSATAAAGLIEGDLVPDIEVDDTIEVDIS